MPPAFQVSERFVQLRPVGPRKDHDDVAGIRGETLDGGSSRGAHAGRGSERVELLLALGGRRGRQRGRHRAALHPAAPAAADPARGRDDPLDVVADADAGRADPDARVARGRRGQRGVEAQHQEPAAPARGRGLGGDARVELRRDVLRPQLCFHVGVVELGDEGICPGL